MSRSRRKHPYITDQQYSRVNKQRKRWANKAVRDTVLDNTPKSGAAYKKESNSYDIRDYSFFEPDNRKARNK